MLKIEPGEAGRVDERKILTGCLFEIQDKHEFDRSV
jgi:hypothetical protein